MSVSPTRRYLEISFPIALPRPVLTYHLDHDGPEPLPGARVIAPLNGRPVLGYLCRVSPTPPEFATKAVLEILDLLPLLSAEMVELGFWMADRCLCSPGEAFHAMIPGGIKGRVTRVIAATEKANARHAAGPEAADEAAGGLPSPLAWLVTNGPATFNQFANAFPHALRKTRTWTDEGLVTLEYRREGEAGPRLQRVIGLIQDKPLDIESLTPKERQVVEFLLKTNQALPLAQICRGAQVSSSPVTRLVEKGVLEAHDERVEREVATESYYRGEAAPLPPLTVEQQGALAAIRASAGGDMRPVLIRGVTCSGKTEVYLRWVSETIETGRGAIVLVPEIALTPQMVRRFRERFGMRVAILHSKLSDGERFDQWEGIRQGRFPVVVGARSGVFAPLPKLGTIILDEEGEPSFKQGEAPRYHARDLATRRCELENALLVMGSATPTLEAYQSSHDQEYRLVEMLSRVTDRVPPRVEVVDMRLELTVKGNRSMFSQPLSQAVEETLKSGKQAILYLNRRGHSTFVLCRSCGESVGCSKCGVSLVYHSGCRILRCHYCGEAKAIPDVCPLCRSSAIKFFGGGTQRVEAEARRYFPRARIERMDSDSVSAKGSLEGLLERFGAGEIDILVGTQMVAKGLDFPNVTLVGILAADSLLRLPDYRAAERNFSLLAQVAGRAGRGDQPGKVVLQTYYPEHHSIRCALTEDFPGFFAEELRHRQESWFPPFCHLASFIFTGKTPADAQRVGELVAGTLRGRSPFDALPCVVLGPAPAPIERINNLFRFQLLAKAEDLAAMTAAIREVMGTIKTGDVRVGIDIDPFFSL